MRAAASLAVPQNTGNASAGMKRASASTHRFGASAASALAPAKTSRMATNRRLRSTCASAAVSGGPASMTVKANSATSCPACGTDTPKSRASAGIRPTIRNSVETMTKAARARMMMAGPEAVAGVAGKSGVAWGRWVACIQP